MLPRPTPSPGVAAKPTPSSLTTQAQAPVLERRHDAQSAARELGLEAVADRVLDQRLQQHGRKLAVQQGSGGISKA
jgi:hypothetical protein